MCWFSPCLAGGKRPRPSRADPLRGGPRFGLAKTDEGEMAEGRHGTALDQAHIAPPFRPARESLPGKFRAPAEAADHGLDQALDLESQAGIRADAIDEDDLAARAKNPRELVERGFRM